jgi:hypothetical protein
LNSQTDAYIRVKKYENIISCLVHGHGSFPLLCHSLPPNNTTEQNENNTKYKPKSKEVT